MFGDSYSFVYGEFGYPAYTFIGDYRPGNLEFTPEELLSNRIFQNFTHSTSAGGPNWSEYLTSCAVEEGQWYPRECDTELWNFAFAGASFSEEFLEPHADFTTPMVNQTEQFLTWADPVLELDKSKALVAIWIGINDLGDAAKLNVSLPEFYDAITEAIFAQSIQSLYDAGYKNFLMLNIPPRDRSPAYRNNEGGAAEVKQWTVWWNGSLNKWAERFAGSHADTNIMVYDTNTVLNKVLDSPQEYGILNTTHVCDGWNNATVIDHPEWFGCRPLETYFWLNSGHM